MNPNKFNLPFEYRYGDLVILSELTNQILNGEIDFAEANLLVDETVAIVDEVILRIGYGEQV